MPFCDENSSKSHGSIVWFPRCNCSLPSASVFYLESNDKLWSCADGVQNPVLQSTWNLVGFNAFANQMQKIHLRNWFALMNQSSDRPESTLGNKIRCTLSSSPVCFNILVAWYAKKCKIATTFIRWGERKRNSYGNVIPINHLSTSS